MLAVTFFMIGAFGATFLAAVTVHELFTRFLTHLKLHHESRSRVSRDLKYRKIL